MNSIQLNKISIANPSYPSLLELNLQQILEKTPAGKFNKTAHQLDPNHPDKTDINYARRAIPIAEALNYFWNVNYSTDDSEARILCDSLDHLLPENKTDPKFAEMLNHVKISLHQELQHPSVPTRRGDGRMVYTDKSPDGYQQFKQEMQAELKSCLGNLKSAAEGKFEASKLKSQTEFKPSAFALPPKHIVVENIDISRNFQNTGGISINNQINKTIIAKTNIQKKEIQSNDLKIRQQYTKDIQDLPDAFLKQNNTFIKNFINNIMLIYKTLSSIERKDMLNRIHETHGTKGFFGLKNSKAYTAWKENHPGEYKNFKNFKDLLKQPSKH